MANLRLRSVMQSCGFTTQELASELGVDPKTVERWLTRDTVPHRTTALSAARLLSSQATYLWPGLEDSRAAATGAEVVGFYPHRHKVPKSLWVELLRGAQREITLMAYASLFLPEDNPGVDPVTQKESGRRRAYPHRARRPGHARGCTTGCGGTAL